MMRRLSLDFRLRVLNMYAVVKGKREPGGEISIVVVSKVRGNEVLVKLKAVSICGTDVHVWNWNESVEMS